MKEKYSKKEAKLLATTIQEMGLAINKHLISKVDPQGKDELSKLSIDDPLMFVDLILRAAGASASLYSASVF